jgi:hypothetical protein
MAAIHFSCTTNDALKHADIKNRTFLAGGFIYRENVRTDEHGGFKGELEIISEGGTLYREAKELELAKTIYIIE